LGTLVLAAGSLSDPDPCGLVLKRAPFDPDPEITGLPRLPPPKRKSHNSTTVLNAWHFRTAY